ncbi:heparinase II/III domain-containing protein [Paenibacillus koleovorans]|uniref:heparinase II/III domain-containing protein n=1 Tax=Paenibacillus koleovorans TaxID=121608 RepID=UPI00157FD17D|nr:heparinase II/III family protein [Paenibacillus koleovorans]
MRKWNELANRYEWCAGAVEQLRAELDKVTPQALLESIPVEPGGWWHDYVCREHHTELEFDPAERDAHVFRCPHGCRLEGQPFRGSWLVFKHWSLARYSLQAAVVYAATGDAAYADLARGIVIRYAELFPHYPVHPDAQPWMLKGRAFHQALTESIWATTVIRTYLLLSDQGVVWNASEREAWAPFLTMLEDSMTQYRHILIHERNHPESNYTAWLNAALGAVYAAQAAGDSGSGGGVSGGNVSRGNGDVAERGDAAALERMNQLIEGVGGFRHHLAIGVKPDQFEFEGSTYYHVFVLRAYFISAEMAARVGVDLYGMSGEGGQSLRGMLDVLAALANDKGELPAMHDGPYKRIPFAREIAEVLETGYTVYGNEAYLPMLAEAYRQLNPGREPQRNGLEAVLFGSALRGEAGEAGGGVDDAASEAGGRVGGGAGVAGDGSNKAGGNPGEGKIGGGARNSSGEGEVGGNAAGPGGNPGAAWDSAGAAARSLADARYGARDAVLLADSGFVVLRHAGSPLSAILDFGEHGGTHGHYDKLHLSLEHSLGTVAPELGVVPYGSIMRKGWYKHTSSHNTVSIDGRSQAEHIGECKAFAVKPTHTYTWLRSEGAYEGCVLDRHLVMTGSWLLDWFEVRCDEERQIDWWMHHLTPAGGVVDGVSWSSAEGAPLGEEDGYSLQTVVARHATLSENGVYAWTMPIDGSISEQVVAVGLAVAEGGVKASELLRYSYPGTADDPSRSAYGVLHRRKGQRVSFIHVYCAAPVEAETGAGLPIVLSAGAGGSIVVEDHRQGGTSTCELTEDNGLQISSN